MEFGSLLAKGGPVVYILLALSVYVLSIVIYKIHVLSKVNFFRFDVTLGNASVGKYNCRY